MRSSTIRTFGFLGQVLAFRCGGALLNRTQKIQPIASAVTLLHLHGSAVLVEPQPKNGERIQGVVYVGPEQSSPATELLALMGSEPGKPIGPSGPKISHSFTPSDEERVARGWLYRRGRWFRPVFVPPSRHKPQYNHWYCSTVRRRIHSLLPDTQRLIFAGYSFPEADREHVTRIFVREVMSEDLQVEVVNPDNEKDAFRSRAEAALRGVRIAYSFSDFRAFCEAALPRSS